MKAILEFNMPEDDTIFKYAANSLELVNAIHSFDQELRRLYKYEDKETIDISLCRDLLREKIHENIELEIF
jgi:hypothetical protein